MYVQEGQEAILGWMTNTKYLTEIKMEAATARELPARQIASLSVIYFEPSSAQRRERKS